MKKLIATATLVAMGLLATESNAAEKASVEENVGVASGAIIGASAGGPVGFLIGAIIGSLLGEEVEKANRVDEMSLSLQQAELQSTELQNQLGQLQQEAAEQHRQQAQMSAELLQIDLLFATNVTALDDFDRERVEHLAKLLNKYPELSLQLDGFADPRGDAQSNLNLSQARVDSVRQLLVDGGVDPARLFSKAYGESESIAPEGNMDAYALERRVSIRLVPNAQVVVASNP